MLHVLGMSIMWLKKLEGVIDVNVNIANDKMTVTFDRDILKLSQIKKSNSRYRL